MRRSAPFSVLFFAGAAHGMNHVLLGLYVTLVLVLAQAWHLPYNDLIALWTLGAMLVGLGSPFAGLLGDRFGETKLLILCFFGLGGASVLCGLAQTPSTLEGSLALLGLSGSIYHPVGNAWIVKHAQTRGKAIAFTGIVGSIGVAAAPIAAAGLAALWSWRVAFIAPGMVTIAIGAALFWFHATKRILDRSDDAKPPAHMPTRGDIQRAFVVLSMTMMVSLVTYSAFGTAMPKLIQSSSEAGRYGLFVVGLIAGGVQLLGASAQFIGGHFADGAAAKRTYMISFLGLAAVLPVVAFSHGWTVVPAAVAVIFLLETAAPIETTLLAHYTPPSRRGLIFGIRYALGTIGSPLGVYLVARLYDPNVHFSRLLLLLAAIALVGITAASFLPAGKVRPAAALP